MYDREKAWNYFWAMITDFQPKFSWWRQKFSFDISRTHNEIFSAAYLGNLKRAQVKLNFILLAKGKEQEEAQAKCISEYFFFN